MAASCTSKESLPWADLPTEMVDEVVGHLDIFSTGCTAQFSSVCPSWAKAVTTNPALPFGTPCLLMSLEDDEQAEAQPVDDDDEEQQERNTTFGLLELYSPWRETTTFPACIRAMRNRYWVGAKDDWLATVDESCNAELVNPYSGHRVRLPSITTIPGVELTDRVCGLRRRGANGYDHVLRRIVVCETPSADNGYLVIGIFSSGLLAVARGGEHSWTALKNPREAWSSSDSYRDAIAHKGKVFAVGTNGYIYAWDLGAAGTTCHEPVKLRSPQANHGNYKCPQNLAESADGCRLLLVYTHDWRYKLNINLSGEIATCDEHGHGVHLYELDVVDAVSDQSDGDHGWSRVTSLGDRALFLGYNYPFLAKVDRGSELLRPNSVCFTMNELFGYLGIDFDMVVLDLDDQDHQRTKLFHSNRYYSFQSPIWFRPRVVARQRQSI